MNVIEQSYVFTMYFYIMTDSYNEYLKLLQEFKALPNEFISESIFDIAGYPHYENVCSNILAFYLNPTNEHGLGNLLLFSLLSLANGREINQENIQINREVSTIKGGRLDIVIETDNQIIGIENKIRHHLNNDLVDYSASLDAWAKPEDLVVKIILSLRKEDESSGFICITYEELWARIRERIGGYQSTSSQKWLLYLVDFMTSIENLYGENMEISKNDAFFIENDERVNEMLSDRNKFIAKLNSLVKEVFDKTKEPDKCEKQWIYAKSCLVHDFKLSGHVIAFDLYVSPKGWKLELFGRDPQSKLYLSELVKITPPCNYKLPSSSLYKDQRYVAGNHDLKTSSDEISKSLIEWMNWLIEAESKRKKQ